MRTFLAVLFCFVTSLLYAQENFRPPSVPLVVYDPYFSIWSPADKLTDAETVHWTGKKHPLHAMIRIDGKTYRLMGAEPKDVPAMEQKSIKVGPLVTVYTFENEEVRIVLSFCTPLLPDNLELMSRPATYLICSGFSKDNTPRNMAFYFDAGAEIAVNQPEQIVTWSKLDIPETTTIKLGTVEQPILAKRGDDLRIDWGHMLFSVRHVIDFPAELGPKFTYAVQPGAILRKSFVEKGMIPEESVVGPLPAADLSIGQIFCHFWENLSKFFQFNPRRVKIGKQNVKIGSVFMRSTYLSGSPKNHLLKKLLTLITRFSTSITAQNNVESIGSNGATPACQTAALIIFSMVILTKSPIRINRNSNKKLFLALLRCEPLPIR